IRRSRDVMLWVDAPASAAGTDDADLRHGANVCKACRMIPSTINGAYTGASRVSAVQVMSCPQIPMEESSPGLTESSRGVERSENPWKIPLTRSTPAGGNGA